MRKDVLIVSVLISLLVFTVPIVSVSAKTSEDDYRWVLERGFKLWLQENGYGLNRNSDSELVSELFNEFLVTEPDYQDELEAYCSLASKENTEAFKQFLRKPSDPEIIFQEGTVVDERTVELDDGQTAVLTDYTYKREEATKVTIIAEDGTVLVDPYAMAKKYDITIWVLWWEVKIGEDGYLYYLYKKYGAVDEAYNLIYKMRQYLYVTSVPIAVICGLLAPYTYGLTVIPGALWAFQVVWIVNELQAAYHNSQYYLQLVIHAHLLYTGIGSWVAQYTIWDNGSWHMLSIPLIDIGFVTSVFLAAINGFGSRYGWNRWVWLGYYYA